MRTAASCAAWAALSLGMTEGTALGIATSGTARTCWLCILGLSTGLAIGSLSARVHFLARRVTQLEFWEGMRPLTVQLPGREEKP